MGKCIADGIAQYRFDVSLGIDALLMSWGCSGMEPATGVVQLLMQLLLGGWLRFFMAVYSKLHYDIVWRVRSGEEKTPDKKGA
ncbi:3-keto-dihydrosphingosine reductase [Trypanosoma grayi]|uniref:3-keto-dihydrosphingosine reductase n=1 Tax=Trypanosoma grayi TaxID=71804 RepID=UPI0004F4B0D9|nr:3-keto-dihydrosphingosine reductase [Trypanosoma grayi]KEG06103.1 3-keto-dihydrosphingosine reductase [Trypanosoma grayi]